MSVIDLTKDTACLGIMKRQMSTPLDAMGAKGRLLFLWPSHTILNPVLRGF